MIKQSVAFLGSKRCFYLIAALFVIEALWIALSGRYPMAFDENFHLGIIRLYAHHISPFWGGQPPGADGYGAVARDPSYLYQWLMSFPYRLSSNVIFLRVINIGLFAWGLFLYRRLLLKTGASKALVHFCMALFVLIPVVPLLAAQINYDNLFFPLTGLILLLAVNASTELVQKKRSNPYTLGGTLVLCLLACLIKYAFLPIFAVVILFLAVIHWQVFGSLGAIWASKKAAFRRIGPGMAVLLVMAILMAAGLFVERYGVNLIRYHKPVPSCDQVLSVERCKAYSPWYRDYKYEQMKPVNAGTSPLVFAADWFYGMWFRTFFAVDGPASVYQTRGPFVLPAIGAIIFAMAALGMTLASLKQLFNRYNKTALWLFIGVMAIYVGALWTDGYQSFLQTGQPVALNGRYLIPIYPLLLIILGLGASIFLKSRDQLKFTLAAVALLCVLWGGGALTYVLRSNDAWYWPNSPLKGANHFVQDNIGPLVPGNSDPRAFMGRHGT